MPINYLDIKQQLPVFCENARMRQAGLSEIRRIALDRFDRIHLSQKEIMDIIHAEVKANPMLRCALPGSEPIQTVFPLPEMTFTGTILAADGSQVIPSRHYQVEFGAINVAAVSMQPGTGQAPKITTHSRLLDMQDMEEGKGMASEGYIALLRDLEERKLSAELAATFTAPVIALTDGGLELFKEPGASHQYEKALQKYLDVLQTMADQRILYAGYVDKPGSNLVIAMLDVLAQSAGETQKLEGLVDRILFGEILRSPGCRSSVFGIQSSQSQKFQGDQSVHFFFMNVSPTNNPKIARVEIPDWLAHEPEMIDLLQVAIYQQCLSSGSAFPYLLHRAHEEAVIKFDDANRLEELIVNNLQNGQVWIGEKSGKQTLKDLPGRTRMGK
jgi:hypothetical protein